MSVELKKSIVHYLGDRVAAVGFAPVDRFADAPDNHHPSRVCKDAETIIVFGLPVPRGMLRSPDYNLYFLHRTYHTVYMHMDELGLGLCNFIEAQGNHLAVPIPTFAPLVYQGIEPWGIISLKHAAVLAGLGAFGHSGLMYHPRHGSLLRLCAVVTNAKLPGDVMINNDPCPPECEACHKACPSKAFDEDGRFNKLTCLGHTVKHGIYNIAFKDEQGLKNIEKIINTAGYNYWLKCDECLKVCPKNR